MKTRMLRSDNWFLCGAVLFLIGAILFFLRDDLIAMIINIIALVASILAYLHVNRGRKMKSKKHKKINIDGFFILGAVFIILGLFAKTSGIWILGLILFLMGVVGKLREHEKNKKKR
ncbi:hypothetical protein GF386_02155 [Candidatus Pacearchaeota archaeon]|nr:hypothetical protein [Candidatus Pacearchaeota archaeon]MBD3282971.1 hypothetical protein [Candidatus Pacearchaeota archaeon]